MSLQPFSTEAPQDHHTNIHHDPHVQLQDASYLQAHHASYMPTDPAHTLTHLGDRGYHPESDALLTKQLVDVGSYVTGVDINSGSPEGSPDRKRRRMNGEQQVKRHKYDVLKSFFRIYFKVDNQSMVLKDALFNLYSRKIPSDSRIARNAMYRHMWSFFKEDKISAFQSNYREYIKGIKLLTGQELLSYEGFEKDLEVLQSIGVQNLFDFHEEELAKSSSEMMSSPLPITGLVPQPAHSPQDYLSKNDNSDDDILHTVESIEAQAKALSTKIKELKAKLALRKK